MKRALLISVDFPPHKDGVSAISEAMAQRLTQQGYALWVIGPRAPGDKEYDRAQPFRVLRSPGYDWGYLRFIPLAVYFFYALIAWRPEKIFPMNIGYGGILAYLFRFAGYRYYLWAYGYEFEKARNNPRQRALYCKIYGAAARVFVISKFVAQRLQSFGVPSSQMRLVYPALSPGQFKPCPTARSDNAKKVILSVSRLVERKGQDQVLRALPGVLEEIPGAEYWIAGEGPMRESLQGLARSLGVEDRVRFLGKVNDGQLLTLYNQCDVFVMPSRECPDSGHVEGFGIVFLEANACGKPVIGGRSGGMPEAIEEGKSGLLVNPEDMQELALAIRRLLRDTALAESMGSYGCRRVEEMFHWDKTFETMELN